MIISIEIYKYLNADISLDAPRSVRVVAGEKVAVGLSVLCRHQHVDDGVGAGAQID